MMHNPFFSIIMPAYNAEKTLIRSLDSVLRQTYDRWELICMDDGSTDSTVDILKTYADKYCNIHYYRQKNAGPTVARVNAFQYANGGYFVIFDADDELSDNYLELVANSVAHSDAEIIVPDVTYVHSVLQDKFKALCWTSGMIFKGGDEALSYTIPWRLHGHQITKRDLMLRYYTLENASYSSFNSDEYITRILYYYCNYAETCAAQYKYYVDSESITHKFSLRTLDYLKTEDKMLDFCIANNVDMRIVQNLYNEYYVTLKGMYSLCDKLSCNDRIIGEEMLRYYYHNSYKAKFIKRILKGLSFRTKLKFFLSMLCFNYFKLATR